MDASEGYPYLALVMRLIHIGSAIVVVGGFVFYRLVLVPVLNQTMSDEARSELYEPLMRKWKLFVHPTIILFLVSGFYNYIAVTRFEHEGQSIYHALFGVKFLLALIVFALAIVLTSTMEWSTKLRNHAGLWWVLMVALTSVVVLGSYLKVLPGT